MSSMDEAGLSLTSGVSCNCGWWIACAPLAAGGLLSKGYATKIYFQLLENPQNKVSPTAFMGEERCSEELNLHNEAFPADLCEMQ